MKLLLVEDNQRLAERISYHLRKSYIVDVVESGEDALEKVQSIEYGVILLDLGLPGMSGLEVCKNMRRLKVNNPILVLTGNSEMTDRINLLNAGADDYVTKPFNTDELRARIAAVGRRQTRNHIRSIIKYRDLQMDVDQHKVSRSGIEISLRRKEFDILEYLISNKGRIMTRAMIMDHVWSSHTNSWTSTVDVHIKHLRDKVDRPFENAYIKTAYGLGYKIDEN
ncbi:MAG TPA: response regulator transcription factor [Candidatus Microsaccharimonas sp.]|jgi:two-component system alkaline phosphatase synthesis response regulator PhoP